MASDVMVDHIDAYLIIRRVYTFRDFYFRKRLKWKKGSSKRTSCPTSSAPWFGAAPFLPSNQYPSFQESWSPYGTHSCTMSCRWTSACLGKNMSTPQQTKKPHWKSTGTWTFRFRTSSFETQQSTIRDCINVFPCSKKYRWMWITISSSTGFQPCSTPGEFNRRSSLCPMPNSKHIYFPPHTP